MRYYIDTNTLVFFIQDNLDNNAKDIIYDYENKIYVSATAVIEFIHLIQYGRIKFKLDITPTNAISFIQDTLGFEIKHTNNSHLNTFAKLPLVNDHSDPNDRMIIAQAITEKIPIISTDAKFPMYQKFGLQLVRATH